MDSIYERTTLKELTQRLDKLTASSKRLWGKMDVAQMLAHCSNVIEMAIGEKAGKSSLMGKVIGPFVKGVVTSEKPFKQNMPTDNNFIVSDSKDFYKEKVRLTILLTRLSASGPEFMHNRRHSFFGKLTSREWSNSTVKHLDHHFRQFGV